MGTEKAGATSAGLVGGYAGICAYTTSLCSAIGAPASAGALTPSEANLARINPCFITFSTQSRAENQRSARCQ
jgi:hypothetical protein